MADAGVPPCPDPALGPGPGIHRWADAGECVGSAPADPPPFTDGELLAIIIAVICLVVAARPFRPDYRSSWRDS